MSTAVIPRLLPVLAAAAAILAAPAAIAQIAPSNPARAALAALDRQADALFAAAARRDWTGAQVALDGARSGTSSKATASTASVAGPFPPSRHEQAAGTWRSMA